MYFRLDCKKIISNKTILILILVLLLMMIIDPISVYLQANIYPSFFEQIGENPFQYWLLINPAGWGNQVFNICFFILPVFFSGAIFYYEQSSSMSMFLMVRKSKLKYYLSKASTIFLYVFFVFCILLVLNLLITYLIFPNKTSYTEQYSFYIPNEGTFAYTLYSINPFFMGFVYCILNALSMALISVFYLNIQIIVKFKNHYVAMIAPILVFYSITFILDSILSLWHYNLRLVVQPLSASTLSEIITITDITTTFSLWFLIDIVLLIIGIIRNKDII